MKLIQWFVGLFAVLLLVGCGRQEKDLRYDPANPLNAVLNPPKVETGSTVNNVSVVDYGQNVYYFPHTGAYFANSLAGFLSSHPNLEVTTTTDHTEVFRAGYDSSYSVTCGYFVTFREKR